MFLGTAVVCEAVAHFLEEHRKPRRTFERLSILSLVILTFGDIEAAHYRSIEDRTRDALLSGQSTTIAALIQQLSHASKTISDLRSQADDAEKEASKAELALAKLKAPRSLTAPQQARLVSQMKRFAGTQIDLLWDANDAEATGLAVQLFSVLSKARWEVALDPPALHRSFAGQITGTTGVDVSELRGLMLPSGATAKPSFAKAAVALSQALQKLGLLNTGPGRIVLVTDSPNTKVLVVVGRKPF